MFLNRLATAVDQDTLGEGLVSLIQVASLDLAISYAPHWHKSQLIIVAAAAGRTRRPVRRNELLARFASAVSMLAARACLIGFRAFT